MPAARPGTYQVRAGIFCLLARTAGNDLAVEAYRNGGGIEVGGNDVEERGQAGGEVLVETDDEVSGSAESVVRPALRSSAIAVTVPARGLAAATVDVSRINGVRASGDASGDGATSNAAIAK